MRSIARGVEDAVASVCELSVSSAGVASITLNNPQKRNALSLSMVDRLHDHVSALSKDASLRMVVLRSTGTVFSSGHNLVELKDMTPQSREHLIRLSTQTMQQLHTLSVPVLCCVDGLAAAAGAQLVAHCDMAVCTQHSTFSTPGIRFGFFCTTPGTALFRSSYSPKMLNHMLFTGDAISSEEALRIGVVSHVLKDAAAMEEWTTQCVERIISHPKEVISLGKRAYQRQSQMRVFSEAMNFASDIMLDNLGIEATQEGLKAFAEKRKPKW